MLMYNVINKSHTGYLRSVVTERGHGIISVTGTDTDLVGQAVVRREELLRDVCAVCVLPVVASSKHEQTCNAAHWLYNIVGHCHTIGCSQHF